jgi:hypothetical protein
MKKIICILLFILVSALSWSAWAQDSAVKDLTAETAPLGTDILYMVKDPGGTALDRKVAVSDITKGVSPGLNPLVTNPPDGLTWMSLWNFNGCVSSCRSAQLSIGWDADNSQYRAYMGTVLGFDGSAVKWANDLYMHSTQQFLNKTLVFKSLTDTGVMANTMVNFGFADGNNMGDYQQDAIFFENGSGVCRFETVKAGATIVTNCDNTGCSTPGGAGYTGTCDWGGDLTIAWESSSSVVFTLATNFPVGGGTLRTITHTTDIPTRPLPVFIGVGNGSGTVSAARTTTWDYITVE